ncbi:MAG: hypothetical protein GWP44_12775 [Proteobacteria bacterium]|nr:hypothetical protein [Pseudomonadota bacterium]
MLEKAVFYGSVLVAFIAVVAPAETFAHFPMVLVLLGLASGFMRPTKDVSTRVAYYVLAALLPSIASNLDVVPVVGSYASGFLTQFTAVIAGVALANIFTVLVQQLKDA